MTLLFCSRFLLPLAGWILRPLILSSTFLPPGLCLPLPSSLSFSHTALNICMYVFIRLHWVLVAARGIYLPDQGSNLAPLDWEYRVIATGPPGKSQLWFFLWQQHAAQSMTEKDRTGEKNPSREELPHPASQVRTNSPKQI